MSTGWEVNKILLGWVPLDKEGTPHQPLLGSPSGFYKQKKKPITVYLSQSRAEQYSPVGESKPVFVETPFEKKT